MSIEEFRDYCLAKPGTTEETPFGPDTLVFKVMGKMYALTGIDTFQFINLKCDPEYAIQLREQFDGSIRPGFLDWRRLQDDSFCTFTLHGLLECNNCWLSITLQDEFSVTQLCHDPR